MAHIVLLTGLAGAGKTTASDVLEDIGFYVIENLPVDIVLDVVNQMQSTESRPSRIAIAVDIRDTESIQTLFNARESLRKLEHQVDLLYLDADDDTIIKRFEQTRRPHPYISAGVLTKGIEIERELLSDLKTNSDVHIDTTTTNPTELSNKLKAYFDQDAEGITIVINSFGFKHGLPRDADFVFDVRFLPNPYWEESLREMNGNEDEIQKYVKTFEEYEDYINSLKVTLGISINQFSKLGKSFVSVAFGCTGGLHRSVTVALDVAEWLKSLGYNVVLAHREISDTKEITD